MVSSSALFIDLYQLTMAYGYWKHDMHEKEAAFHLLFRRNPYQGQFALNCGLATVIDFLKQWHFTEDELSYLRTLKTISGEALFSNAFLCYLKELRFSCSVFAIPEGTLVFAEEPLLRIEGPLLQCQLLESPLLNIINFQTLIATKAARVCHAAENDPVIEFGMRRAQGLETSLFASRASYIGGCIATSNTRAGQLFDIPVRGTHAHSWVSAFKTELEAFYAYAEALPAHCILLVDTYDSIKGTLNAITVGKALREKGYDLLGVRLDSGDIAAISQHVRRLLDEHGFNKTLILASNALDEYTISDLKQQGAAVSMWGVGTHLVTAYDQPALDGVYKLSALCNAEGEWEPKLKLSEQALKISHPGRHQIRRYFHNGRMRMDLIYEVTLLPSDPPRYRSLMSSESSESFKMEKKTYDHAIDLLKLIFNRGRLVYEEQSLHHIRERAIHAVTDFYRYFDLMMSYTVGLEEKLSILKNQLIAKLSMR